MTVAKLVWRGSLGVKPPFRRVSGAAPELEIPSSIQHPMNFDLFKRFAIEDEHPPKSLLPVVRRLI